MNIRAVETTQDRAAAERQQRVDLAACYRLVALYGWDDLVFTHISGRVPGPEHHFLIGSSGSRVGGFGQFQSLGSMQVRTFKRRYSWSRRPYDRRWMTRILLLSPSTKPSETLLSGWQ